MIQEALDRLMQGRTTLILAHRLSSVIDCDRILAMEEGRVVESGSHGELRACRTASMPRSCASSARVRGAGGRLSLRRPDRPTTETLDTTPGGAKQAPTEGVIKAEGLSWLQVVAALMRVILPWKGRLGLTFLFGVVRVLAFIGVGAVSALIVFSLKNGQPWDHLLVWLWVLAPMAGIVHWLESWVAHDMAYRLLAEMRIDAFRKLTSWRRPISCGGGPAT